jgi:putative glutamine amidotransferase
MQTLNVATGGTMIQDIPSEVYNLEYVEDLLLLDQNQIHHNYWRDLYSDQGLSSYQFHQIRFLPGQFWTKELKMKSEDQPLVYSNHHQALGKIGKGFVVGATSLDGKIVESIHHNTYRNVLGVQFHPENYLLYKADEKDYKKSPVDSVYQSNYDILDKNRSLEFHYAFWNYFSALFQ